MRCSSSAVSTASAVSRHCCCKSSARALSDTTWRRCRSISSSRSLPRLPLVLDRRFLGGDPLAIGGDLGLAAADRLVDLGRLRRRVPAMPGLGRLGGGQRGVAVGGQLADAAFGLGQPLAQPPPIDQPDLRPQLLQAVGVLLVAAGLAGLRRARSAGGFPPRRRCRPAAAGSDRRVPAAAGPRPS